MHPSPKFPQPQPKAPRELGFLLDYGAPAPTLRLAAERALALGVAPDVAAIGEGLVREEFFYRALADRLGVPFHVGPAPLDPATSPARALSLGLVYLARLTPYRAIAAPRGDALKFFMDAAESGRTIQGLAITSPRRLAALVRVELGRDIAASAAHRLESLDPSLCARGEITRAQTLVAAGFGLCLIALAGASPGVARAVSSGLLWMLFTSAVSLRFAASVAGGPPREVAALEDGDLPVYTVLVALYRETAVIPKLAAGLERLDYPGIR